MKRMIGTSGMFCPVWPLCEILVAPTRVSGLVLRWKGGTPVDKLQIALGELPVRQLIRRHLLPWKPLRCPTCSLLSHGCVCFVVSWLGDQEILSGPAILAHTHIDSRFSKSLSSFPHYHQALVFFRMFLGSFTARVEVAHHCGGRGIRSRVFCTSPDSVPGKPTGTKWPNPTIAACPTLKTKLSERCLKWHCEIHWDEKPRLSWGCRPWNWFSAPSPDLCSHNHGR